jgi:AGZA family xanthine/uracil permease-like MFS transporter
VAQVASVKEQPTGGGPLEAVARYFKFAERGTNLLTETRAGVTTFMVMAYIIFLNGSIIAKPLGLDPAGVAAGTCLVAGVMTIAMGIVANYPFALAAGLGINGIVAFSLPAKGFTTGEAMGVIVVEGLLITLLVVIGLREAIMSAVPMTLKRSIGVGIGLFILFIGFVDGGLIKQGNPAMTLAFPTEPAQWLFLLGLAVTFGLYMLRIKAALIISIVIITVVALALGVTKAPAHMTATISWDTFGKADPLGIVRHVTWIVAILTVFSIMLSDFFDTMGTVTGIASEAKLTDKDGNVPGVGRILIVDSLAAVAGGAAGVSSNTTYIESAAGVAEGGRTGWASVITGAIFLVAILISPLAPLVPFAATGPALVLVGYLMFSQIKDIQVADPEEGIPALLTIILMPLTYDITVGIGAGFVTWTLIKVLKGKWNQVHPLVYGVTIAFAIYFANVWIQSVVK